MSTNDAMFKGYQAHWKKSVVGSNFSQEPFLVNLRVLYLLYLPRFTKCETYDDSEKNHLSSSQVNTAND